MIKWINNLEERVEEPTNYSIEVDVKSAKKPHREYYLSNCLLKHVKVVFWEDAVFEEGAKCNHLNDFVITSVDSDEVKSYWRRDPWFVGKDHNLEDRFEKLKSMMGEEPLAMCRASHSGWDDEYYKNFIRNEERLLEIGANLWG